MAIDCHQLRIFRKTLKSGCQRKPGKMLKMSTEGGELVHTNIVERLGGVMNKYTKHKSFTALVLEIRASLYLTYSGAIFTSKFCQFSETHRILKIGRPMFILFIRHNTTQDYFLKP